MNAQISLLRGFDVAARVLFVYDYFLTLDLEVEYFWHSRLTRATLLFFANRYTNIVVTMLDVITMLIETESDLVCNALELSMGVEFIVAQVILALFSTLRVHAIVDRKWTISIAVFLLSMLSPVLVTYMYVHSMSVSLQPLSQGCALNYQLPTDEYNTLLIIARSSIILCDFIFVLTVLRVVGFPWTRPGISTRTSPVTMSLLRSSSVFFIAMLLLNTAQVVCSLLKGPITVSSLLSPLTSISITRMLTSLRQANRAYDDDFLSLFVRDLNNTIHFASDQELPGEYAAHLDGDVQSSYPHIRLSNLSTSSRRVLDVPHASPNMEA